MSVVYKMILKRFLVAFFIIPTFGQEDECKKIAETCHGRDNNCRSCIRAHHCCIWCSEENFGGRRCGIGSEITNETCDPKYIVYNHKTIANLTVQKNFTDLDSGGEAVQFSTQEFDINLRLGEPINITISYRPAKNYPLDLYYLMDLTYTMQPDLDVLKKLGSDLANLLIDLTTNYRIAFGSYIDKIALPFYSMDEYKHKNPCNKIGITCEQGYLFKHKLNFTKDMTRFTMTVNQSDVSGNKDNLEGGFDVLMQLLFCEDELDWSPISRKLVIVATDGFMHLAGDGILSGSTKRNRHQCLFKNGEYIMSTVYDYPSLEEVHHELKNKKTNLIVASKGSTLDYYRQMAELLKGSIFVDELKVDSTKVLKLVEEGYYAFVRQVALFMNTSAVEGLQVDYFTDCDATGEWTKQDMCNNAQEGKEMKFILQFLLTQPQDVESETLYVEEKNIHERVKVNFNFVGTKCKCAHTNFDFTCEHGIKECGNCTCDDGWTGETCSSLCLSDFSQCRYTEDSFTSLTCSGLGECKCGRCHCEFPYQGKFCQYRCPFDPTTNTICNGHGMCDDGECACSQPYTGPSCACLNSTEDCVLPGTPTTCSDNGVCECNRCKCAKGFHGKYCQDCDGCDTQICDLYEKQVVDGVLLNKKTNGTVKVEIVGQINEENPCVHRFDGQDGNKCDVYFKYHIQKDRTVLVKATKPLCNKPMSAGLMVGSIVGAFALLCLLIVLAWKGRNMQRDRKEYYQFVKNRKATVHQECNPIYRSPLSTYHNPNLEMNPVRSKKD